MLGALNELIRAILGEARLLLIDIGARGDLPEPWLVLDGIADVIGFEADEAECEKLRVTYATRGHGERYRVVPCALTASGGARTFYLTASRGGSSLFDPDIPLIREHVNRDYLYPVEQVTVMTRSAAEVFTELGESALHVIKLDIQGCELEVLEALQGSLLDATVLVELEAAMQPHQDGYPTFCEINSFMLRQGFELLDLWPDRAQRAREGRRAGYLEDVFGVCVDSPSVSARIWESDLLYVRPASVAVAERSVPRLQRTVVALAVYGFFSEALHHVEQAQRASLIDIDASRQLQESLVRWHRLQRFQWRYSLHPLAGLYRRLIHRLGLPARTTQADYIHRLR